MYYLSNIPETITPDTKCIIMLHGVGSNEADLFELGHHFGENTLIVSLQGPFSLGMGRYAWYPVDFSTGKALYSSVDVERGYREIIACIHEIEEKFGIKNESIYLLGFSQGAIMSYYTLWKSPEKIGGIIALSGRILDEIHMDSPHPSDYRGKRVFVGHGTADQVIPFTETERVKKFLSSLSIAGSVQSYPIGHIISQIELSEIDDWINL